MDQALSADRPSTILTEPTLPSIPPSNTLSDVFSDSAPSSPRNPNEEPSEIPRLRATHVTAGYREGISASKDQALQPGFDEGYPLGAIMGLRVGYILGTLEGLYAAQRQKERKRGQDKAGEEAEVVRMQVLLQEAREQLKVERIFGKEFWESDGTWRYEAGEMGKLGENGEGDEDVTLWVVADRHPTISVWLQRVREESSNVGLKGGEEGFNRANVKDEDLEHD